MCIPEIRKTWEKLLDDPQSLNWSRRLMFRRQINHPVDSHIIGAKCKQMKEEVGTPSQSRTLCAGFNLTILPLNFS